MAGRRHQILQDVRRFLRDQNGSITMEFMIWLPWLMLYTVFMMGAFIAMDGRLDAARSASTITDLVSRQQEMTPQLMQNIEAINAELLPSAPAGSQVRISGIRFIAGTYDAEWSACFGGLGELSDSEIPVELMPTMAPDSTILLVESYVPFIPITGLLNMDPFYWSNRKVIYVRSNTIDLQPVASYTTRCVANAGGAPSATGG